ncbi:MAG: FHA domain-containing protein [Gemmataceae bacterium]|jgi:hypothetical protein
MKKCPFCYTKNEEVARFCVLCKSDISIAESASESVVDMELVVDPPETNQASNPLKPSEPALVKPPEPPPIQQVPPPKPVVAASAKLGRSQNFRLVVLRGQRREVDYPLFPGPNIIGRSDAKPVDVDLECQEDPKRIWVSRQHAVIHVADQVSIEDLNSSNGTYVNRERIFPGQKHPIVIGDMIQIGGVQLKLM